jgi:dTDP-4-amino-4,6-dideoxygalactose transaminase
VCPGDEVITVPHTFIATVAAIRYIGATPVFVDIEADTMTMDPARIEAAISLRTRAIVPVHLYGHPADMDRILAVARRYGLKVIEDCAQAHGATYRGKRVGSLGDFGCFSFYPSKNLGAYGEGGLVTTNDDEAARVLRMLRDWGAETKNEHVLKGYNMRLEGVQGAVLGVKLQYLDRWTEQRRACAAFYREALQGLDVDLPVERPENRHVYHLFPVRCRQRQDLQTHLASRGVQTGVHYPTPVHLQPAHADLHYCKGDFPVAEAAAETELSIPIFPELTREQQEEVVAALQIFSVAGVS